MFFWLNPPCLSYFFFTLRCMVCSLFTSGVCDISPVCQFHMVLLVDAGAAYRDRTDACTNL